MLRTGRALAIIRSGYEAGELIFSVSSDSGNLSAEVELNVAK